MELLFKYKWMPICHSIKPKFNLIQCYLGSSFLLLINILINIFKRNLANFITNIFVYPVQLSLGVCAFLCNAGMAGKRGSRVLHIASRKHHSTLPQRSLQEPSVLMQVVIWLLGGVMQNKKKLMDKCQSGRVDVPGMTA